MFNHIIDNRKIFLQQIEQNLTVFQYTCINNNATHSVYAADSVTRFFYKQRFFLVEAWCLLSIITIFPISRPPSNSISILNFS